MSSVWDQVSSGDIWLLFWLLYCIIYCIIILWYSYIWFAVLENSIKQQQSKQCKTNAYSPIRHVNIEKRKTANVCLFHAYVQGKALTCWIRCPLRTRTRAQRAGKRWGSIGGCVPGSGATCCGGSAPWSSDSPNLTTRERGRLGGLKTALVIIWVPSWCFAEEHGKCSLYRPWWYAEKSLLKSLSNVVSVANYKMFVLGLTAENSIVTFVIFSDWYLTSKCTHAADLPLRASTTRSQPHVTKYSQYIVFPCLLLWA